MLVHRRHTLSAFAIPCVETEPPGHHVDEPGGGCQRVGGLSVPPEFVVRGAGNPHGGSVTVFLSVLRRERQSFRTSETLGDGRFESSHAFEVC